MSGTMQDAIKVLQSMGPIFNPTDDYLTIAAAEEQMSDVAAQRQKEQEEANMDLKSILRQLDAARKSCTRPLTVPSEEAHAETLNSLYGARLSLMKSINDADGALTEKESALGRLKEECSTLEQSDPAAEHKLDATPLKLALIRGLGFTPITDKNGYVRKVLVRSRSGEVHSVSFEEGRPLEEYSDMLWSLASE